MSQPGGGLARLARSGRRLVSDRWVARRQRAVQRAAHALPEDGYPPSARPTPLLDAMSAEELRRLNGLLAWHCFTVDGRGRRVGGAAWAGKRVEPQAIPDPRIVRLDELVPLAERHVLEVGCFEGVHTIALCDRSARVTAVDGRVDNFVKTMVRAALYECRPEVFVCDVEGEPAGSARLRCDVAHHVGVLYHLADPVGHLQRLLPGVRHAIMLDTHVARPDEINDEYDAGGRTLRVRRYVEHGLSDPFSGMQSFARWLRLDDLLALLGEAGFRRVLFEEKREERNGLRVNLVVARE